MADDPNRIPRAQARREMALTLTVVVVLVVIVFGQGVVIGVVDRLDPLVGGLIAGAAVLLLVWLRRRRGTGWVIARGALIAIAIAVTVVVLLFSVCVATSCVR